MGEKAAKRAEANRAHHARLKASQDHLLLRLQRGDRARMDAAAARCGISRAAFAQLYLVPFSEALTSERVAKLAMLGGQRRLGLGSLLGGLIDLAPAEAAGAPASAPAELSGEFDALFGSGS